MNTLSPNSFAPPLDLDSVVSATLASGDVDLCLVPESDIVLDGPRGCLPHIMKRVRNGRGTRVSKHSAADKDVLSFGALS